MTSTIWAQSSHAGPVTGVIDAIRFEGDQYYVYGWACQEGQHGSIDVHLYVNHAAGDKPPGRFVTAGTANLANEEAVDRECHDSPGGKHRFRIALPNQLLRTIEQKKLYMHGIAITGNVDNALLAGSGNFNFPAPKWPPDPPTPNLLVGSPVATFDTDKDACEQIDIPDAAARAFRDSSGTIHLIASHYLTRAAVGPTLETVRHSCQVAYKSAHDGNVANLNDATWLTAFYSIDGKRIVALGHMEYHGWEHPGMCPQKNYIAGCWYNATTFALSQDGGYHFAEPAHPRNYVLSLPYQYQVNRGPEGYSSDTGIVKVGRWFYASAYSWAWPPHCGENSKAAACLVSDSTCPIRTDNILDPTSWRGWDGKDFTVTFENPYVGTIANPSAHICKPVPYLDYASGINYHPASHLFVATLWNQGSAPFGPQGLYFTTSPDFIHWSKPVLALTLNQMIRRDPVGNWSYAYFSLLDPNSPDSNFTDITDTPYLYYVRSDNDHGPYRRILFRQRIKLDWLLKTQAH